MTAVMHAVDVGAGTRAGIGAVYGAACRTGTRADATQGTWRIDSVGCRRCHVMMCMGMGMWHCIITIVTAQRRATR